MLVVDAVIACLLVLSIVFCWKLNARIGEFHKHKAEFKKVVNQFNDAILRAEASLAELRRTSEITGNQLQEAIQKAKPLLDDLHFMTDRSVSLADRLEEKITEARALEKSQLLSFIAPVSVPPQLTGHADASMLSTPVPQNMKSPDVKKYAIETLLERISAAKDSATAGIGNRPSPAAVSTPQVVGSQAIKKPMQFFSDLRKQPSVKSTASVSSPIARKELT